MRTAGDHRPARPALGLSAIVAPGGVPVSQAALSADIPVMVAVAIAVLPVAFVGYIIKHWEGFLILGFGASTRRTSCVTGPQTITAMAYSWGVSVPVLTSRRADTMIADRPSSLIDPVCGMAVEVSRAQTAGLLVEHEGRTYAFCRSGCRRAFLAGPEEYAAQAERAASTPQLKGALPVIDEGMRRWYESCACCLSDAYPDIKAQLDAERAALSQAPVEAGICEVAESASEPAPL